MLTFRVIRCRASLSIAAAVVATQWLVACGEKVSQAAVPAPAVKEQQVSFPPNSPQLGALDTAEVRAATPLTRRLTGRVVWDEDRTVRVYSAFGGRVESIAVHPGDRVAVGQRLAVIGSPDFGQAQSEAHRARTDFAIAQSNLERVRDLTEHGVAADKDLKAAEADFERARAELSRTQVRGKLYGDANTVDQRYVLKAPLAGVVVEKNINPGQEVRPDQITSNAPPLFVITDPLHLWVQLDATESDVGLLHAGQKIALRTSLPGPAFEARIDMVSDSIDPNTRMIRVRASVANPQRALKGEMFVTGEIPGQASAQTVVPAQAVFLAGDRHFVFVADGAGHFQRTEVIREGEMNGQVAVRSALKPGQRVVVGNTLLLQQLLETQAGG
jgi:membrane fusion protein, heavy metal efflux system